MRQALTALVLVTGLAAAGPAFATQTTLEGPDGTAQTLNLQNPGRFTAKFGKWECLGEIKSTEAVSMRCFSGHEEWAQEGVMRGLHRCFTTPMYVRWNGK